MSAERSWDQRRFVVEESAVNNGGKRTIFVETMSPGVSVPPHFHTKFSETFDLIKGAIKVYKTDQPDEEKLEASAQDLKVGEPKMVEPLMYHKYKVGEEVTALRVTLTPGNLDFERVLKIMNGLAEDGELEKFGDSKLLMGAIFELTDAHLFGPAKAMSEALYAEDGDEIRAFRKELLEKYDTDEALKKLLVPVPVTA
ncbi:hypothetical protein LSUE1_G008432 [Lachnellula suecica]|uniref:Cupin type-1 domain-containing protein n=1 Tax=Lachnellula suecica TaxID=602035 RepID=A0A8T9BTZ6_9HELO|nr:hypothetical protein LSUE1_G008432 [Lachnellula suecica]